MKVLRNTLIVLATLCVVGAATSAVLAAVNAQDLNGGVNCVVDEDGNGLVEISELFNVIDWYFNGTQCLPEGRSDWTVSIPNGGEPIYAVLSQEDSGATYPGPWWLSLECNRLGSTIMVMGSTWGVIFKDLDDQEVGVTANVDGVVSEHSWSYLASSNSGVSDYLSHPGQGALGEQLLSAEQVTFSISVDDMNIALTFPVSGLSQHIDDLSDVCDTESEGNKNSR